MLLKLRRYLWRKQTGLSLTWWCQQQSVAEGKKGNKIMCSLFCRFVLFVYLFLLDMHVWAHLFVNGVLWGKVLDCAYNIPSFSMPEFCREKYCEHRQMFFHIHFCHATSRHCLFQTRNFTQMDLYRMSYCWCLSTTININLW